MAGGVTNAALLGSKCGPVNTLLARAEHTRMGSCFHMSKSTYPGVMVSPGAFHSLGKVMCSRIAPYNESWINQPSESFPEICKDKAKARAREAESMNQLIEEIREMFRCMTDGEVSVSPYDTAWVAFVPALDGSGGPQFPKSLQWIIDNQLADGSWGFPDYFSYFDRVLNTLACIVVMKTWKTESAAIERGVQFIQQNLQGIERAEMAEMSVGFEIVFPALISAAKKLELDLPYDASVISTISAELQKKLKKIPIDTLHKAPTTLLFSLEGLHDHQEVDWEKLLDLQNEDGSFINSPAATAACLLHTKDEKALGYLTRLVNRFNNAVPPNYPVDLFEHLWVIDRLERLGIDRYFEKEIEESLDYVYESFTNCGIGWARGSPVQDLDDTSMGFRLLRKYGYDVSENVFQQFRGKAGDFFSMPGQSSEAGLTGLFNFYRAAQTRFPGEGLLEAAEPFARGFLADKFEANECFDKWVIPKDLAGEVEYVLETPWYCSLPRIEVEAYLNHYGTNDIWIGKTHYRMPFVHNETFLSLAKADFNLSQAMHQLDLQKILRWNEDCGFGKLTFARQKHYEAIFLAVCVFPDPERAPARLVWARQYVLTSVVDDYFNGVQGTLPDLRRFIAAAREWDPSLMDGTAEGAQIVFNGVYNTINAIAKEGRLEQGRDIGQHLKNVWLRWLESRLTEAEWTASGFWPSFDEYLETALPSISLEPIVLCTLFFLGEPFSDELVSDSMKLQLMDLVNQVGRLLNDIQDWQKQDTESKPNAVSILKRENSELTEEEAITRVRAMAEKSMLELVRQVHSPSAHIPKSIRHAHFNMARVMQFFQKIDGFTDFSESILVDKMKKILFQPVL